jgi:AcrR family transcriptional regulator
MLKQPADASLSPDDPESTRNRIFDAALDVFAHKGFGAARIEDIAKQAQTSKSAIYFHFASKERLFLSLADQFADLLERRVVLAVADQDEGMARVRVALEVCIRTFGKYRRAAKILLAQGAGLGTPFEEKRNAINERFARLIAVYLSQAIQRGEIDPVNVEVISLAWMGAIYALVIHWVNTNEPEPQVILETLTPALLKSIGYGQRNS